MGSSPHTRGARCAGGPLHERRRIIPAYAGSTPCGRGATSTSWDHPRIRGEHSAVIAVKLRHAGSSPHTRGARPRSGRAPARRRDHPRIRGEHRRGQAGESGGYGSSPHTRGALPPSISTRIRIGIIPAYAGSTSLARGGFGRPADHPRIRGEHISCSRFVPAIMGSSPHTRGARGVS